tara:strand:- start:158 stop:340 length:183 start_codon:yes stop_codon:yes gene_type:complete
MIAFTKTMFFFFMFSVFMHIVFMYKGEYPRARDSVSAMMDLMDLLLALGLALWAAYILLG